MKNFVSVGITKILEKNIWKSLENFKKVKLTSTYED